MAFHSLSHCKFPSVKCEAHYHQTYGPIPPYGPYHYQYYSSTFLHLNMITLTVSWMKNALKIQTFLLSQISREYPREFEESQIPDGPECSTQNIIIYFIQF